MQKQQTLSRNQKIIFDLIDKSPEPMKAYSILFNVQKKGIKAPLQVYRALDKLVGVLLITGMLIIPTAMARNISDTPQKMVVFSIIGGLLSVFIGLFSSLEFNTPSGPSIITAALLLFIISLLKIKQTIQLKN